MMTAFAKGSTKGLDIIQAYKRLVTPLVGAELFTSSATEIREALTTQQLNAIQPALYAFVRAGIRELVGGRVPERGGWSGPVVIQEVIGLSIFRQACFALVSPALAADRGEYLHSRMKSMEVSCRLVASFTCLDPFYFYFGCRLGQRRPLDHPHPLANCGQKTTQARPRRDPRLRRRLRQNPYSRARRCGGGRSP